MTMTHEEFQTKGWAEKYFLNELNDSEMDQFEEHYFQCVQCAAEVKMTAQFLDGARAVFGEETSLRTVPASAASVGIPSASSVHSADDSSGGWLNWFRWPQLAMLAAVLVVSFGVYRLNQPVMGEDLSTYSRGAAVMMEDRSSAEEFKKLTVQPSGSGLMIPVFAPDSVAADGLTFDLFRNDEKVYSRKAEALENGMLGFAIPSGKLQPGVHKIVLRKGDQELGSAIREFKK
jgi:hypothetical protein